MKNFLTIASTLVLGSALALSACGKDKKPSTEPAAAEPAKTDPAKPADPAAPAAANPDKPKDDKPAAGGW
jgi:ABC-type oligopeptide transport system substrate-binding subunit